MEAEIKAASAWWAEKLAGQPSFKNGEVLHEAVALAFTANIPRPTPAQLVVFREELERLLLAKFKPEEWRPDNPWWAGAFRTLTTDYLPCKLLLMAAQKAGIPEVLFPWKTCMRINPGWVEVACGYRAPFEVIFGVKRKWEDEHGPD